MVVMSSLATGLDVLRALAEPPFNYTLSELATSMNIGRSGLYKILSQLREKNFVHQDRSSKKYHLGPVMLRMGNVYSGIIGIEKIAAPILSYLCKTIGESVYISIWEGDRAYPVFKCCRPDGIYDTKDFIGKSIPINAGASAKLLAAFQNPEKVKKLLEKYELDQRTPYTLTSIPEILEEFKAIRAQKYAVEDQSFSLGVWCMSIPIYGRNQEVTTCLSVGAHKKDVTDEKFALWLQQLNNGADEIGTQLQLRR